jgi:hemoglobin/transferrin/lactoferrin receptor protein
MKNNTKLFCSISVSACLALSAMAEDRTTNLGEVSVTDTAFESQIKSITSEKLDNTMASDIKDILANMPGVSVSGNSRYSQKVYLRGLEDKASNITIDGANIGGEIFHHVGSQTIDAETLKVGSIEVGPNSALSGPGVINGSFRYETKDASDYLEDGQVFGGKISRGYQSAYGRKSFDVSLFSKINDKFEIVGILNKSEDNKIETPEAKDITSKQSDFTSALLKMVFKPTENHTFKFSANLYEDGGYRQLGAEKAGGDYEDVFDHYNEITRETFTLGHTYSPQNDLINLETKIYKSSEEFFVDGQEDESAYFLYQKGVTQNSTEPETTYANETSGIDIRNTSIISNHNLTYGASYDKEEQIVSANGLAVYTSGVNIGTTVDLAVNGGISKEYAMYIQDEIELDKLLLTIGARYDIYKLAGTYSEEYKQLSPKLKVKYQASENLSLRAGYGRIFKGPSLSETFLISSTDTQDSNSQAQTGHNYEAGFDYDLSKTLNTNNSIFGFTIYTYNVDGYMDPSGNSTLTNQEDIKIWGVESVFRYETEKLSTSISHTYNAGESKSLSTGAIYEPMTANIHTIKVDLDYQHTNNLSFNYNAEFVRSNKFDYYYSDAYDYEVDRIGYSVHNMSTTYNLQSLKGMKVSLGIDNILNKRYSTHTTFGTNYGTTGDYETGRNYKIKLSYKF